MMRSKFDIVGQLRYYLFGIGQLLCLAVGSPIPSHGQIDSSSLSQALQWWRTLSSERMLGRGYAHNGVNRAADYLVKEVKLLGAKPYLGKYEHHFQMPIHYFPKAVSLRRGKEMLRVGVDFLPAADCPSVRNKPFRLVKIDSLQAGSTDKLEGILAQTAPGVGFLLPRYDKLLVGKLVQTLADKPCAGVLVPQKKFTHTLAATASDLPVIYIKDSLARVLEDGEVLRLRISAKDNPSFDCRNVMAYLPGDGSSSDSILLITAHYDHLGQVGDAIFYGANDNASGTAMGLSLLSYYQRHPAKRPCSLLFVFFAGEEAGLLGSKAFLEEVIGDRRHKIAMLNLDLMGGGSEGLMLVNGQALPQWVARMQSANEMAGTTLLPAIRSRPNAPNSDHYWFAKAGIPAVFAYTMGGVSAYHDVYDRYQAMDTSRFGKVWFLLSRFIEGNPSH